MHLGERHGIGGVLEHGPSPRAPVAGLDSEDFWRILGCVEARVPARGVSPWLQADLVAVGAARYVLIVLRVSDEEHGHALPFLGAPWVHLSFSVEHQVEEALRPPQVPIGWVLAGVLHQDRLVGQVGARCRRDPQGVAPGSLGRRSLANLLPPKGGSIQIQRVGYEGDLLVLGVVDFGEALVAKIAREAAAQSTH